MRKNLHDRILKIESKEQHLSTVPKFFPKKFYYFWEESKHIKRKKKKKRKKEKKSNHAQIDNLKFP